MFNWLKRFWNWLLNKLHLRGKRDSIAVGLSAIQFRGTPKINICEEMDKIERREILEEYRDIRNRRIAVKNQERQKSIMGYGLKSGNFKPRPAFEKSQWNLQKKPEEEDD